MAAVVVGVVKFFVRAPWDRVAVVGDLLPAIGGILIGLALLVDFAREGQASSSDVVEKAQKLTTTYRIPLGMLGVAVAILHFFFPTAVIL